MKSIEFTFDFSLALVAEVLKHPKLAKLFSHWKSSPIYQASVDIDSPDHCFVTVKLPDEITMSSLHEAADIIDAFLTGYFANK